MALAFLVLAGLWLFVGSFALACVIIGGIGQRLARRRGRQCPECDYRGDPVEMLIHRTLEHEQP